MAKKKYNFFETANRQAEALGYLLKPKSERPTTEPPTQEGWYWAVKYHDEAWIEPEPQIVFVFRKDDKFIVTQNDYETNYDLADFTLWLGPLPVPELQKGL